MCTVGQANIDTRLIIFYYEKIEITRKKRSGWLLHSECRVHDINRIIGRLIMATGVFIVAGVLLPVALFSGCLISCSRMNLKEGHVGIKRILETMLRYRLIQGRSIAMLRRCRDEALRCVATRRVTSRTGVVSGSANLEKTGSFAVKIMNNWCVFQCTVNWSRARLTQTLILAGSEGESRGIYSVEIRRFV